MRSSPRLPRAALLLLAAVSVALAADAAAAVPDAKPSRIVFAMKGDAVQFNPVLATDYHSNTINYLLFEGLLHRDLHSDTDETDVFVPRLAESMRESMQTVFRLHATGRIGADGPTPDAAVARIEEARRDDKEGALAHVARVERLGTDEVAVHLTRIDTEFPTALARILGREVDCRLKPVLEFTLRQDIFWHDGMPVTAEDVKFTYDTIMSPATQSSQRANFELVERVEAVDPRTVRATYATYYAKYLEPWMTGIIPRHVLLGENVNTSLFNRHPVGNGPYKFKTWAVNDHVLLVANERYHGGRALIDEVVFRVIPDEAHMFLELLAGRIDVMQMKPDQYRKVLSNRMFDETFTLKRVLEPEYTYLGYNLLRPPFDDVRVRRALTLAIDRERLVDDVLKGYGKVVSGPFHKDNWACDPSVAPLPFDPAQARALLYAAGFRDVNGDGVLEKDMGDRDLELSFEIRTNVGNKDRELTLRVIGEQFRAIGARPRTVFEEWGKFVTRIDAKDFDAILLAWNLSFDPDDTFSVWHSREIPDLETGKYGLNAISYSNPEVDRLFEQGRTKASRAERQKAYFAIHRLIADEQPYSFLYSAESLFAIRKRVLDAKVNKVRLVYNLHTWRIAR